jgi:hypothetical protein
VASWPQARVGDNSTDHATNHRIEPENRDNSLIFASPLYVAAAPRLLGGFFSRQDACTWTSNERSSALPEGMKSLIDCRRQSNRLCRNQSPD